MRTVYEERVATATEIERHIVSRSDKFVAPPLWVEFAKICWPQKTATHIAAIAGRDKRTAERWLSGEFEPPMVVVLALFNKMFERREN